MKFRTTQSGYTFVELLIVVAIIGILSSVIIGNLSGARERARDSKRVTAIGEIALALELYYNKCRQYPSTLATTASNCTGTTATFGTYLSTIPVDPLSPARTYTYTPSGTPPTRYVLKAVLEQDNTALTDDLDGTQLGVACGDSAAGYNFCKGSI